MRRIGAGRIWPATTRSVVRRRAAGSAAAWPAIDGLEVGDVVTGEQMRLLFAEGRHPLAETSPGSGRVLALGVPYRPSTGEQPFQAALRARFADHNTAPGPAPPCRPAGGGTRADARGAGGGMVPAAGGT